MECTNSLTMRLKLQIHLLMIEESVSTEKKKTSTSIRSTPREFHQFYTVFSFNGVLFLHTSWGDGKKAEV